MGPVQVPPSVISRAPARRCCRRSRTFTTPKTPPSPITAWISPTSPPPARTGRHERHRSAANEKTCDGPIAANPPHGPAHEPSGVAHGLAERIGDADLVRLAVDEVHQPVSESRELLPVGLEDQVPGLDLGEVAERAVRPLDRRAGALAHGGQRVLRSRLGEAGPQHQRRPKRRRRAVLLGRARRPPRGHPLEPRKELRRERLEVGVALGAREHERVPRASNREQAIGPLLLPHRRGDARGGASRQDFVELRQQRGVHHEPGVQAGRRSERLPLPLMPGLVYVARAPRLTAEDEPHDGRERVHVGPRTDQRVRLPLDEHRERLLRSAVLGRHPGDRHAGHSFDPSDPAIDELRGLVVDRAGDEDVVRLQVAVKDLLAVQDADPFDDPAHEAERADGVDAVVRSAHALGEGGAGEPSVDVLDRQPRKRPRGPPADAHERASAAVEPDDELRRGLPLGHAPERDRLFHEDRDWVDVRAGELALGVGAHELDGEPFRRRGGEVRRTLSFELGEEHRRHAPPTEVAKEAHPRRDATRRLHERGSPLGQVLELAARGLQDGRIGHWATIPLRRSVG